MPYVVAAVTSPFIGIFIGKFGYRKHISLIGTFLMIIAHFMQCFMADCEKCGISIVPLVFLGLSYAIYAAAIWGGLPLLVEPRTLGSAFGIVNVAENLGTIIAPPIMGAI